MILNGFIMFKPCWLSRSAFLFCALVAALLPFCLLAVEESTNGTGGLVQSVEGKVARIIYAGGAPQVGDAAEFFFEIAGVDDSISVATGKVIAVEADGRATIQIESATGEVAKDQMVRFPSLLGLPRSGEKHASSPTLTVPPSTPVKSGKTKGKKSGATEAEWTDLTNAAKKIVGSWKGGRHVTQYLADGSFYTDPHLVPNPPRGQWRIEGDRLTKVFPQASLTTVDNILSITANELVIRNAQGQTFRFKRGTK